MVKTKERKAITRKRSLLNFLIIAVIGIGTGIFLGSWYSYAFLSSTPNYGAYTEESLKDDINVAFANATKIKKPSASDKENWVQIAHQKGVTPLQLSASENLMLAEYNLINSNSFYVLGVGKVATIATQSIHSATYFDGSTFFSEKISKGILTVADAFVMKKGANEVTQIKGTNVSETSATWTGADRTVMTATQCKEKSGVTPDTVNPYIVSSQTIISGGTIKRTENDGKTLYSFTIGLDPIKSVLNYVKQVKQTSGLTEYPTFDDITLTITFD